MRVIDESFDKKALELKPGEELEIHLPENPTTGYRWHLASEETRIVDLVDDQLKPSSQRPGAGGERSWRFRAVRPGAARIELASRRSWEAGAPARSFTVDLRVGT